MEVEQLMEVRVAVCGNVDSGKSSLLGVLTKNILDNGRGKARIALFRHPHEVDSGRTSSVGMDIMGFDPTGVQVGVSLTPTPSSVPDSSSLLLHKHTKPTTTSTSTSSVVSGVNYHHHYQHSHLNSEKSRVTWDQITTHSSKLITLFDLAGHEKYLKTTVYGLCGTSPDFSILTIGANMGIVGMTKEHLGLSLALGVPVMIVITKIDMCPTPVLQETVTQLLKIVKSKGCRKLPMFIRNMEDVVKVASLFVSDRICPIFLVSNVTGEGLNYLRQFINLLPLMSQQKYDALKPTECLLSENFSIPGVGTVVSVTVMSGTVHLGDTLYLGPNAQGGYVPTQIKGIHIKYVPVPSVSAGHTATLALKKIKRAVLRKGMVLLAKDSDMIACQEFEAEMLVLSHSTTIHPKYQATLHCLNVRQTATVISIADHTLLRTGDKAVVRFRFVNHPEHLKRGSRLLFREGRTKCIGNVVHVFPFKKETSMLSNERELNGGALTGHGFLTPATSIFALSAKARKQLRKQLNVTDVLDESKFFTSSVVTG
ncbi:Short integuments 2, mitochondrial [Coelomomyces lativittatus]|nr:Short integuments 2, mitochondrial [Coelomomyces lativittatus]